MIFYIVVLILFAGAMYLRHLYNSYLDEGESKMYQICSLPQSSSFYDNYHGHGVNKLKELCSHLSKFNKIYLLGDSSMDNKAWVSNNSTPSSFPGYKEIGISKSKEDICYHLNDQLNRSFGSKDLVAVNCAVEESTIRQRRDKLLPQDVFVRDNLTSNDILIVSVGGNDIALRPTLSTIFNILTLKTLGVGYSHFIDLFKNKIEDYLLRVCEKNKPRLIIVNMIYFPDEKDTGGWASHTLNALNYSSNPSFLQGLIKRIFQEATQRIYIPGVKVVPFPMYEVLDGKTSKDYSSRVEPSSLGGKKLANAFLNVIKNN